MFDKMQTIYYIKDENAIIAGKVLTEGLSQFLYNFCNRYNCNKIVLKCNKNYGQQTKKEILLLNKEIEVEIHG